MTKDKVLIICEHNSARSLMAEAFLKKHGGERFDVESAGLDPREPNPLAVASMREVGLDISGHRPRSVFDLYREGRVYAYVITVCGRAAEHCPVFPGVTRRMDWPFADPAGFTGDWEERLARTGDVRDAIEGRIKEWLAGL